MIINKNRAFVSILLLISFSSVALDNDTKGEIQQNFMKNVPPHKINSEAFYRRLAVRAEGLINKCGCPSVGNS